MENKFYMNTWANYNTYGADGVTTPADWMAIDEAIEYFETYAEFEPFINDTDLDEDYQGLIEFGDYSGLSDLEDFQKIVNEDFGSEDLDILRAFLEDGYSIDEAIEKVKNGDFFYLANVSNDSELAQEYIWSLGGFDCLGQQTMESYFDYEAFGRDLSYDGQFTKNGFIFKN